VAPVAPSAPPAAQPLPQPPGLVPAHRPPHRAVIPHAVPAIEREFEPRRHGPAGGPVVVGMGPTFAWRRDPGYGYVTGQDRTTDFDLFASYDVLVPVPSVVVAAGLDYRRFSGYNDHNDDDIYVYQHLLMADLTARLRIDGASWLAPHLRLAAGMARDRVELDDDDGAASIEEQATGFAASLGGGVTLRTPIRAFETRGGKLSSLSFGVLAEAGYTLGQKAELRAAGGERNGIARAPLDLGALDRSAPYLRLAGVARF
jgi:hypothetical protein